MAASPPPAHVSRARRLLYGNDEVVHRFIDGVEGRADRLRWISAEDGVAVVECMEAITGALGIETLPPAG